MNEPVFSLLEEKINYIFKDKTLLNLALTHRSFSQHSNERLEYLGDATLGFIIAAEVFNRFPQATEGELTRLRSTLVKGETLIKLSRELDLGSYVRLGPGELKNSGRERSSILENTLEAIIGAVYLDAGMETCRRYVIALYHQLLSKISLDNLDKDPKTTLQELLQSQGKTLPVYQVLANNNHATNRQYFTMACVIGDADISVHAEGHSKRIAEQLAAKKALSILEKSL